MNKSQVKTKEDLEEYYNKTRKIKFADNLQITSIEDIFSNIKESSKSQETYFMRGKTHCDKYRCRSLDDYLKLCKYYFPETTVKDCIKKVEKLVLKPVNNHIPALYYCPNIRKDNFRSVYVYNESFGNLYFFDKRISNQGFLNCKLTIKELLI